MAQSTKITRIIKRPFEMTNETINHMADNELTELKIVFTDPKNGKQLRVFAKNTCLVTQQISRNINSENMELEFFCQNLQYSDKNP